MEEISCVDADENFVTTGEEMEEDEMIGTTSNYDDIIDEVDSVPMDVVIKAPAVYSWGRFDTSSLLRSPNESQSVDRAQALTFANQRTIMQISSNLYHTCAITSTGEIYTCGSNEEGESQPSDAAGGLDQESRGDQRPRIVEDLGTHRICMVSCGLYHTVCLTASGLAVSFGGNESGQCGHSGQKHSRVQPKVVDFTSRVGGNVLIKQIATGELFTVFLTTSGEVYTSGAGTYMGVAKWHDSSVPQAERVDTLLGSNVVLIAAGASHAFSVTSTGEIYAWGNGKAGQLGLGDDVFNLDDCHIQVPRKVNVCIPTDGGEIIGVSAGQSHSLFWTNKGLLLGCGSNKYGQLASMLPRISTLEILSIPGGPVHCLMAACGQNHTLLLCRDSNGNSDDDEKTKVLAFGSNNFGQIDGSSSAILFRNPVDITDYISEARILYIAAGGDHSFAVGVLRNLDPSDSTEKLSGASTSIWMKRQFSRRVSSAPSAMSTHTLLKVLTAALEFSEDAIKNKGLFNPAIATACELLSTPSLLAGSFTDPTGPLQVDVEGVEASYIALMQMGKTSVVRMIGAMTKTLKELVEAGSNQNQFNKSSHINPTPVPVPSSTSSTAVCTWTNKIKDPSLQLTLPDSVTRVLLIFWQCPVNANTVLSGECFFRLMRLFVRLPHTQGSRVLNSMKNYPSHLFASRILKPLQEHLSLQLVSDAAMKRIPTYCEIIHHLNSINNHRTEKIPSALFNNSAVSSLSEETLVNDYNSWMSSKTAKINPINSSGMKSSDFHYSNYPCLLSADAKRRLILQHAKNQQILAQRVALATAQLTGQNFMHPFLVMSIDREKILESALNQIMAASDNDLTKPLRVVFINEEAVDEGGVRKEFFQLLVAQLFSLEYGMFVPTADQRSIWPNQCCLWSGEEYRLVGVLLGLAVYNDVLLDIHLPKVMYRKLLRVDEFELSDVSSLDPLLCEGLQMLLDFNPPELVEEVFCRTFEVEWEEYGAVRKHELIPQGGSIPVTAENRVQYVQLLVKWMLVDSVRQQFEDLYQGFTRVINHEWTLIFSGDDLELLMAGTPHLDFKELQSSTTYIGDATWNASNPTVEHFWSVVHDMTYEEKQKLLLFVTGTNKAPIGGLGNLGFKIQRMGPASSLLPTAHTCFNLILLPEYSTRELLKDRVLTAINECEGFGLK